jgi:hypothetical protein
MTRCPPDLALVVALLGVGVIFGAAATTLALRLWVSRAERRGPGDPGAAWDESGRWTMTMPGRRSGASRPRSLRN